jgi:hypothetical protein
LPDLPPRKPPSKKRKKKPPKRNRKTISFNAKVLSVPDVSNVPKISVLGANETEGTIRTNVIIYFNF